MQKKALFSPYAKGSLFLRPAGSCCCIVASPMDDGNGGDVWRTVRGGGSSSCDPGVMIGIDFGTSNSCVAVWAPLKSRAKVIKSTTGASGAKRSTTPSTVTYTGKGSGNFSDYMIGLSPDDMGRVGNSIPVTAIKSILGNDQVLGKKATEVKPFVTCTNGGGSEKDIDAEVVASLICKELKGVAERYMQKNMLKLFPQSQIDQEGFIESICDIKRVVVGVPATFSTTQRRSVRSACLLAGFEDVQLMVESTAAAMAYGLLVAGCKTVLIFDMGGGTTDITIMTISDGVHTVDTTGGISNCGGRAIDGLIFRHVLALLIRDELLTADEAEGYMVAERSISSQSLEVKQLLCLCCKCKEDLSASDEATIAIPEDLLLKLKTRGSGKVVSGVSYEISRPAFETLLQPLVHRVCQSVSSVIDEWRATRLDQGDTCVALHEVVLVGGSSRVPELRHAVRACVNATQSPEIVELCTSIDADEAVAQGLAIRAGVLMGCDVGALKDILMIDAIPSSIGLLTWAGEGGPAAERKFDPVLVKGDPLPAVRIRRFSLAEIGQQRVSLDVYEEIEDGPDRSLKVVGTYDFPVPRDSGGVVDVRFEMTLDGQLLFSVCNEGEERGLAVLTYLYAYILVMFVAYVAIKVTLK